MTPAEQAHSFAAMLLSGACLGAAYDLMTPLRRVRALCALADLCFGVLAAAGIILTALHLQTEAFRLYAFAAEGCGLALYGATLGAINRKMARVVRSSMTKWKEKNKKRQMAAGN